MGCDIGFIDKINKLAEIFKSFGENEILKLFSSVVNAEENSKEAAVSAKEAAVSAKEAKAMILETRRESRPPGLKDEENILWLDNNSRFWTREKESEKNESHWIKLFDPEVRLKKKNITQYIVTGDSTRNNLYNQSIYRYEHVLKNANIAFINNAASGQSLSDWITDRDSPSISEAIASIENNGSSAILEFSLGLNDYHLDESPEFLYLLLNNAIDRLLSSRPQLTIVLVTPVSTSNTRRNILYRAIYNQVAFEKNLYIINADDVFKGGRSENETYYADGTHPNAKGSKRLIHYIFQQVFDDTVLQSIAPVLFEPFLETELWDASLLVDGKYLNTNGIESTSSSWACSGKIFVKKGESLRISHDGNRTKLFFYNKEDEKIGITYIYGGENGNSIEGEKHITILPSNCSYIRFNITSSSAWDRNTNISVKKCREMPVGMDLPYTRTVVE